MINYLEYLVLEYADKEPDKLAVACKEEQVTYRQLKQRIQKALGHLKKYEIKEQSVVLLQSVPNANYVIAYLALHLLNLVVVPVDYKAVRSTVEEIRKYTNADYVIGQNSFVLDVANGISYEELLDFEMEEEIDIMDCLKCLDEGDMYDILYTTGTTGQSKGVVTTRASVHAAIQNEIEGAQMKDDDVLLIPIPLNHSFGIGKMRAILYLGGTVVFLKNVSMIMVLKRTIEQYKCTSMICVPSALQIICNQAQDRVADVLGNLRFIETASAPFGVELKKFLMEHLKNTRILNRYGSTETPAAIYLDLSVAPDKLESIGKPGIRTQVRIVDDEDNEIVSSKDCVGRLAISGPMLLKEYYNAPDLTAEVLKDGWLYSKDLAYIDNDNYIYLVGRENNVINTGGKKVSPHEIEEKILQSNLVKECAVIGVEDPDGILGQVPVLVYVPKNNEIQGESIKSYLNEKLEKYKIPAMYMSVNSLPRNYMGKLEYGKLQELFDTLSR